MKKIACPHCGQDWIRKYRRKDTGAEFYLCPECESLWLDENELESETELYLNEYMTGIGSNIAWEMIEETS